MKKKTKNLVAVIMMALVLAGVTGGIAMLQHSLAAPGQFDPIYYAQTYPDVAAALGTDATALYNHYVNFGQKEGRIPYAGGQPGEVVDGIANATTETPAVQTPTATVDIGNGPYWLLTGEEVDKATFLQKKQELQQKFDASGYVHVGWTEEQVQARLYAIKEQYPDGTVVGNCSAGANLIRNELYGSEYEFCVGSVYRGETINDEWIYPDGLARPIAMGSRDIPAKDILRVGDMVFTKGSSGNGHVAIVLSKSDKGITVVESNWGGAGKMHWGRFIDWNELDSFNAGKEGFDTRYMIWHFRY